MTYTLNAQTPVLFVPDFLSHIPSRGRPFRLPHLGLTFYGLTSCLCFGHKSQAVVPAPLRGNDIPCIFAESCLYPGQEPFLKAIVSNNLSQTEIELDEAVPLYPPGALNFWHWTLESLPKLLALEETGYSGLYILPAKAAGNCPEADHIRQSLDMFGINQKRFVYAGPTYKVQRLILPQRFSGFWMAESMPLTQFLRQKILDAVGSLPGTRRLYVKRIGRRRVANEQEVMEVLNDFSFETMTPEDLTLPEQWRAMTNVQCSVMPHGANATLTLLQPYASAAVELFSNRYTSHSNLHAARLLKLKYYPLAQHLDVTSFHNIQTPVSQFTSQGINADITVDTLHLRIALEILLSQE